MVLDTQYDGGSGSGDEPVTDFQSLRDEHRAIAVFNRNLQHHFQHGRTNPHSAIGTSFGYVIDPWQVLEINILSPHRRMVLHGGGVDNTVCHWQFVLKGNPCRASGNQWRKGGDFSFLNGRKRLYQMMFITFSKDDF